mgnify:CR=1 FL=1
MRQVNRDGRDPGVSAHGRVLGWLIVLLVGVVAVARTQEPEPPVIPWFETRAPGAFGDSRVAASEEWARDQSCPPWRPLPTQSTEPPGCG